MEHHVKKDDWMTEEAKKAEFKRAKTEIDRVKQATIEEDRNRQQQQRQQTSAMLDTGTSVLVCKGAAGIGSGVAGSRTHLHEQP